MNITPSWQGVLPILVNGLRKRKTDEVMVEEARRLAEIGDDYGSRHPGTHKPGHWQQRTEHLIVRLRGTKGRRSAAIEAAINELDTLAEIADRAVAEAHS